MLPGHGLQLAYRTTQSTESATAPEIPSVFVCLLAEQFPPGKRNNTSVGWDCDGMGWDDEDEEDHVAHGDTVTESPAQ